MLKYSFLICATLILIGSCSSILTKQTPAPVHYQLSYKPSPVTCSASFHKVLRVSDFNAISPYDQRPMVVEKPNGESLSSNRYQWVANPGNMVAQLLRRDITLGKLFPQAVSSTSPNRATLDLTGQIFQFAWRREKTSSHADLQVQVSLSSSSGSKSQILFRKTYKFTSPPSSQGSSEAFAEAMSKIMAKFSHDLRVDLCTLAESRQGEGGNQF